MLQQIHNFAAGVGYLVMLAGFIWCVVRVTRLNAKRKQMKSREMVFPRRCGNPAPVDLGDVGFEGAWPQQPAGS